jgi:hypothetical protein
VKEILHYEDSPLRCAQNWLIWQVLSQNPRFSDSAVARHLIKRADLLLSSMASNEGSDPTTEHIELGLMKA